MYYTLYASKKDEIMEHPGVLALGRSGNSWVLPDEHEMMPLPRGSSLVKLAGRIPVGLDAKREITCFDKDPHYEQPVYAVAALLPQGFTRTLLPACVAVEKSELPLLGYAAVAWKDNKIMVAALQSDEHRKWHPSFYNTAGLPARIERMLKKYPHNRIIRQLSRCALKYGCFTAQNIFYRRWEGGIPTTMSCNARCLGCISEAHSSSCSPQVRLNFTPCEQEIAEIAGEHLNKARDAIISFGQGCEGEPSLNAGLLSRAIKRIRNTTDRGSININTNAGYSSGIKQIIDSGLNSMRVTMFSFNETHYHRYHQPSYIFSDVSRSIAYALERGVKVSINLLVFPGFTDREEEVEALLSFIHKHPVEMIQLRNLNLDPDHLMGYFKCDSPGIGIYNYVGLLKKETPGTALGSYTHPVSDQRI